jgi:Di-haem oxidoreductase, putative peroxidase
MLIVGLMHTPQNEEKRRRANERASGSRFYSSKARQIRRTARCEMPISDASRRLLQRSVPGLGSCSVLASTASARLSLMERGAPERGAAGPDEFRTAPLWGVGQRIFFLHDGRTSDLIQAILDHASPGSEANQVVRCYQALSAADQQDLIDFLRAL